MSDYSSFLNPKLMKCLGEQALQLGAHEYIDGNEKDHGEELQNMGGAALLIVTAPNPVAVPKLLKGC
jgi:D-arabinose 1-dehydrogenase-like Zn-dependent alcohol dehydrogenase